MKPKLAQWLNDQLKAKDYTTEVFASQVDTEPFKLR